MVSLARHEPEVSAVKAHFDKNQLLLNLQNGVLNLEDGLLEEHRSEAMLSKISPVTYDPTADCPRWKQFMEEIFCGDSDLISFVRRACGYSLTGLTREEVVFILLGDGQNGKTVFLETLSYIWGEYAKVANFETFLASKFQGNGPRNDIAALHGARLVKACETGEGRRLSEALIKELTGSDSITARFLYHENFTFRPQFKLWFATNEAPEVRGQDQGIWRRLLKIPFNYTVPAEKRDRNLQSVLKKEASGILNWMLAGYKNYRSAGLGVAEAVHKATREYRESQDIVREWLNDGRQDPVAKVPAGAAHKDFQEWCRRSGTQGMNLRAFGLRMTKIGVKREHSRNGSFYVGVKVNGVPEFL